MSHLDQARRAAADALRNPKISDVAEIMAGKWDHAPAVRDELARLWLAEPEEADRAKFEGEIVNWLIGIRDHTDNETEYDLLSDLISSVENQEYVYDTPAPDPNRIPEPADANAPF